MGRFDVLRKNQRKLIAGSLILLLLLAFSLVTTSVYAPPHSIMREGDLGASLFREGIQDFLGYSVSRFIISPVYLQDKKDVKLLVLIGAERKYTAAELSAYHDFVDNGGVLVIFEDFGNAREVAGLFGISYLDGVIRETNPFLFTNSPDKPMIFEQFISSQLGDFAINPIQLNRATAVVDFLGFLEGTAFPILFTDANSSAFLDVDDDNIIDSNDKISPLPLGILKLFGNGLVAAFGDASIPLNLFWQKTGKIGETEFVYGNAIYALLLIAYLASIVGTTHVYFDETHLQPQFTSLVGLTSWIISAWIGLSYGFGLTFGLTLIALAIGLNRIVAYRRRGQKEKKSTKENAPVNYVSNPTRAERLISEFYILYEYMGDRLLHTANLALLKKIEETTGDYEIRNYLIDKYGPLELVSSVETLWEINREINEFIIQNTKRWL